MSSVSRDHLVPQVVRAIQTVLCDAPEQLERSSGLLVRKRAVTGAKLAQTLILGWLSQPDAGMGELAQQAAEVGLDISAQGLDKRMTRRTATFLLQLLEVALGQVVMADPVSVGLLSRFNAVCLEDSTTIALPAELEELFRGTGGGGSVASCKIFARLDVVSGQLTCSSLQDGRKADAKSPLRAVEVPARTLHLRDRGFTEVDRWAQEQAQQEWVLSYLRGDVGIFEEDGTPIDLLSRLTQQGERGEWRVLVGQCRLPMRLFFEKVTPEVAAFRRSKLKEDNRQRGQALSERTRRLADWSVAVTTVPEELLRWEEALVLLRLRWQIELLFKLWKHEGNLEYWRTGNPERLLCEVVAKLLGLLIQHWMLIVSCWHDPHRSLVKAAKALRRQVALLSTALAGDWDLASAVTRILKVVGASAHVNKRTDAPSSSQLLLRGTNRWSSKPVRPWKRYRKKRVWKSPFRNKPSSS